ncbi:MAG: bacteriocin [Clostridia bacterium]|nr:bacteriocin [Clostridia bacterium]
MMWESIIEAAAANGLWSLLFVGLLVYLLQDSRKREEKYTKTIESLSTCLEAVEDIKLDVKSILSKIVNSALNKPTTNKDTTKDDTNADV